jgi:ankyrin repeat protein
MNPYALVESLAQAEEKEDIGTTVDTEIRELLEGVGQTDRDVALLSASANGYYKVVKLLLDRHANIESADTWSQTLLSWAAAKGQYDVVKLLLDWDANIESADTRSDQKALSWAAENGPSDVVKLLLDRNANIESKDKAHDERTPMCHAAENGHEDIVEGSEQCDNSS